MAKSLFTTESVAARAEERNRWLREPEILGKSSDHDPSLSIARLVGSWLIHSYPSTRTLVSERCIAERLEIKPNTARLRNKAVPNRSRCRIEIGASAVRRRKRRDFSHFRTTNALTGRSFV